MRAALLVLALMLVAVSAHAGGTLRIRFDLPNQDNADSLCVAPVLSPMSLPNAALKGHWRWWPAGGDSINGAVEDSVGAAPLATIIRDYAVANPQTLYRIRVWASDAGGKGCDTTVARLPFKGRPWKPRSY